jgi:hypothetical protein
MLLLLLLLLINDDVTVIVIRFVRLVVGAVIVAAWVLLVGDNVLLGVGGVEGGVGG